MPFGLTNAQAVFQASINDVLRDFLNSFAFVYLDVILIFSRSLEEHQTHIQQVLSHLLENCLFVKAEKYEFHCVISGICHLGGQTSGQWRSGLSRRPLRNYSDFWGSLTSIIGLSGTTVK